MPEARITAKAIESETSPKTTVKIEVPTANVYSFNRKAIPIRTAAQQKLTTKINISVHTSK